MWLVICSKCIPYDSSGDVERPNDDNDLSITDWYSRKNGCPEIVRGGTKERDLPVHPVVTLRVVLDVDSQWRALENWD